MILPVAHCIKISRFGSGLAYQLAKNNTKWTTHLVQVLKGYGHAPAARGSTCRALRQRIKRKSFRLRCEEPSTCTIIEHSIEVQSERSVDALRRSGLVAFHGAAVEVWAQGLHWGYVGMCRRRNSYVESTIPPPSTCKHENPVWAHSMHGLCARFPEFSFESQDRFFHERTRSLARKPHSNTHSNIYVLGEYETLAWSP